VRGVTVRGACASVAAVSAPALTVVVLAGRLRHRAERVLEALARQSALASLEVVIADGAPDAVKADPGVQDAYLGGFE